MRTPFSPAPTRSWPSAPRPRPHFRTRRPTPRPKGPLGFLASLDQRVLRAMRTRGHSAAGESTMKTLGYLGEWGAVWIALGLAGAAMDAKRRPRWLGSAAVAPGAVVANFVVKVAVGRDRPLLDEHPPLAKAPSKLSFPSAHATSSFAAATAMGRVEPGTRPPLYALAIAIAACRPYLGMHYPSDVLAGAMLGTAIGGLVPGLGERTLEERMIDLVASRERQAAPPAPVAPATPETPAAEANE